VLSDALREQALTSGATIWQEKYVSLLQDRDSVTVTTDAHRDIDSRYVIACDGLHSRVASDLGVVVAPRKRARRYGLRQHFQVAPWSSTIEVFYVADAELYITPVSRDTVGVAVLGRKGVNLDDTLAMVPSLVARLANAPRVPLCEERDLFLTAPERNARAECFWSVTREGMSTRLPVRGYAWGLRRQKWRSPLLSRINRSGTQPNGNVLPVSFAS